MSIALVMVWWGNGMFYVQLPVKVSKFVWYEISAYIQHYFPWKPKSYKYNLKMSNQSNQAVCLPSL